MNPNQNSTIRELLLNVLGRKRIALGGIAGKLPPWVLLLEEQLSSMESVKEIKKENNNVSVPVHQGIKLTPNFSL